jgi:RNA polymerase sigma factor (sigma-70 family)
LCELNKKPKAVADGFYIPRYIVQEEDLIARLKNAESRDSAFSQVLEEYQKKVYSIIRKMVIEHDDTDDLVQEVFLKVWTHIDDFKSDSKLFTWIYRIAVNESLNFLRRKRRFTLFDRNNEDLREKLTTQMSPDADEIQLKLQKAILQLPDKQRVVFHLKYFEELSYDEMAEVTDTSIGALKASYHHAVKKIEEWLQKD